MQGPQDKEAATRPGAEGFHGERPMVGPSRDPATAGSQPRVRSTPKGAVKSSVERTGQERVWRYCPDLYCNSVRMTEGELFDQGWDGGAGGKRIISINV